MRAGQDTTGTRAQCDVYCKDKTYTKRTKVHSCSEVKAYCAKRIKECEATGATFSYKNVCAGGLTPMVTRGKGKTSSIGCKPRAGTCEDIRPDSKFKRLSSVVHPLNSPHMACPMHSIRALHHAARPQVESKPRRWMDWPSVSRGKMRPAELAGQS